ncbi:MAG: 50S ribosomal protein L23 [Atribacterota bacterium]|jgi:large subunit ribosomal protein L23|nr:50S ribosomal protein L23 [Atribacterota bacterium]MDD5497076.1 50S ribosomal protein L23 [Atribacterota bacterium]
MTSPKTILIHPIISEKSVKDKQYNKYSFKVIWDSNKSEIKKAIEDKFKIKVNKVNTINVPAKKRKMGRYVGKTSQWKKIIVTVKKGQSIKELDNI